MKEFIEIPFGAKDSELEGWEYNIPEGFIASIENGKIIVKKGESEDERIRKELLNAFQESEESLYMVLTPHRRESFIAWLEKQGEQKPAWSEDDENRFNNLVWLVEHSNEGKATKEGFIKFINSLKTLKGRVQPQWKPSEEQIAALRRLANSGKSDLYDYRHLKRLLEQLEKL